MITILGLDPGLAQTGWGLVQAEGNKIRHLDHGSIRTEAGQAIGERLSVIYEMIKTVIDRYRPAYAGVEALYFAKNRKSAIPVAEARGVLLLCCSLALVPAFEFTPPEIKMAVTGNGRAEKHQVQELVRLVLGMDSIVEPDHAADALAVAVTAYHSRGYRTAKWKGRDV
ncbi:MAG: crossover junction endodeoxyribonuclease RuvC [Spirochaetales bacterium]|nr:crossover junction endodeoxyribonuclease RuvC [Spirochaetales bacterium]